MWDTLVDTPHGSMQQKETAKAFRSQVAQNLIRLKLVGFLTSRGKGNLS